MLRCRKIPPALLIFLFVALAAKGQVASSPFSEFGIGNLYNNGLVQSQGMGGIGISNPNVWYLNSQNPALLVFNRWTVFQAGLQIEKRTATDGIKSQSFQNGNLSYLTLALPIKIDKWTTSIGLTPYSSVNYNISYQDIASGSYVPVTIQQTGKGGINQFYWANGFAVNRYLSLGVKATYLFGSIITQAGNTLSNSITNTSIYTRDYFNGLNLNGGISFHKDSLFKKNYRINVGGILNIGNELKALHTQRIDVLSSRGVIIDSLTIISNKASTAHIPYNFGVGISFGRVERWTVGADFTYLNYKNYVGFTNSLGDPTVGYRSALGFEITPKPEDFTSYFNRVTYRLGATYEKSPILVNGNPLTDIGGTFGFSLPVSRFSLIDLGVKIGRRGTVYQNSIEENYFRIYFGVTFNDYWFIKRKFE